MKRLVQTLLIVIAIVAVSSCRKDFSSVMSTGSLEFSKDTVYLDTIFTNISSATYNLKVYNRSNETIRIPEIQLENGADSNYRLNVDGVAGQSFNDVEILANDSIFVFIETTIDVDELVDPLYTDRILFDSGDNQQDVDLVTLVKDAHFIFPDRDPFTMEIDNLTLDGEATEIQGRFLEDSELTFTNEKPYVIYGYATVPEGKTLSIEAGAIIHFHQDSGIIVDSGATMEVYGTLDEKVIFEGDRLEDTYSNVPGQWGTIWMRLGSINNEIHHAQIKNGVVGLLVDGLGDGSNPTLNISNTEIYSQSAFGIYGRYASLEGYNVVIGDAANASFAGTIGGNYNFTHSTFANYWTASLRTTPTVIINNFLLSEEEVDTNGNPLVEAVGDLIAANFTNCIITGNNNIEFLLEKVDAGLAYNYNIENCLIQFNNINNDDAYDRVELDFSDTAHYTDIILNGTPNFQDAGKEEFIIGQSSDAIGNAKASSFTTDILGIDRSTSPDIGAYQHITFD